MTKKNTLSNLQMAFVLAVAIGQRGTPFSGTGVSVSAIAIARLSGYPMLTSYHRALLKELTYTGWLERTKHFYGYRWHLTPSAWAHITECCQIEHLAVTPYAEIPF